MAVNYKTLAVLPLMAVLSACGKGGAPEKGEVKALFVQQVVKQVALERAMPGWDRGAQPLSEAEKTKLTDKLNNSMSVQSLNCHASKDLESTYDCQVVLSGDRGAQTFPLRFVRKDDGTLTLLNDTPPGMGE